MWNVQCIIWKGRFHYDSPACFSCSIAKRGEKKNRKGAIKIVNLKNAPVGQFLWLVKGHSSKWKPQWIPTKGYPVPRGGFGLGRAAHPPSPRPVPRPPPLFVSSPPHPTPLLPPLPPPTHFLLKAGDFSLASLSSSIWTCQISRSRPCLVCRTCWQVNLRAQGKSPLPPDGAPGPAWTPLDPPQGPPRPQRGRAPKAAGGIHRGGAAAGAENSTHAEIQALNPRRVINKNKYE